MSTIIRSQDDLRRLREYYEFLKLRDFDHDAVSETLNELLVSFKHKPTLCYHDGYLAQFIPKFDSIVYNPYDMDRALDMLCRSLRSKCDNYLEVRSALLMYILGHEVEHYSQFLVSEGEEHLDSKNMERAYKMVYGLDKQRTFLERMNHKKHLDSLVKYNQNNSRYFVERNAQIESYDMLIQVLKEKHPELAEEFRDLRSLYLNYGYEGTSKGNVLTTMEEIGLDKQYMKHYEQEYLPLETRIRYGLPLELNEHSDHIKLK